MSTNRSGRKSAVRIRLNKVARESDVGYGRPPRAHQFKPGQSGYPSGRPKGAKNESTILRDLLHRKIEIRVGGRLRKITILEGILLRVTEDSLKGNTKSAAFILNRYGVLVSGDAPQADLSGDDRAILDEFAQRYLAERAVETRNP